ncbi:trimeric intracellular cation channel family protein [Propionibacteriaceae bacterium G57]|uniref:trimeric intracellular cation channel family protein n=1 Tax=Aestuariimicrobium sp. G57 TaxID=3418485 RepID=UPI003DA79BD0
MAAGLGWLPAILLGTITAVGGGAIRDMVTRKMPSVLGGNTLYATCAIAASGVLVVLTRLGHPTVGMVTATVVGAGLCLVAAWRGWILPEAGSWSGRAVITRVGRGVSSRLPRGHRPEQGRPEHPVTPEEPS